MTKKHPKLDKKYGTTTFAPSAAQDPVTIHADGGHAGYRLVSQWQLVAGRAEPVHIAIDRWDAAPVTATAVRNLPLGDMLEEARRAVSEMSWILGEIAERTGGEVGAGFDGFTASGPQRGRSLTPDVLAEVARIYREAYFAGDSVQQAVADHFVISADAATKRIMKARAAGLLDGIGRRS